MTNNLDLSGMGDFLNSVELKLTDIQPLATTMSNALNQAGIKPPSELSKLAQAFHDAIVAPTQQYTSGNINTNIADFVKKQMDDLKSGVSLNNLNKLIARGGQTALNKLQAQATVSDIFANPFLWVGIVVIVAGIIYFVVKRG